jgi:hypothetical protein
VIVRLNDTLITIPRSKDEFTLGQRIEFSNAHGAELRKLHDSVQEVTDKEDKTVYEEHLYYETVFRTVGFILGADPEELKRLEFVDEVFKIYHTAVAGLFTDQEEVVLKETFHWNDEEWVLPNPELGYGSQMKFGELIDAKQTVKDIADDGGNKFDQILPIAAIYLRKRGEEYREEFLHDGSERLQLMKKLPMTIAEQVGFFLSSITSTSITISRCSGNPKRRVAVNISNSISTGTAGSTF